MALRESFFFQLQTHFAQFVRALEAPYNAADLVYAARILELFVDVEVSGQAVLLKSHTTELHVYLVCFLCSRSRSRGVSSTRCSSRRMLLFIRAWPTLSRMPSMVFLFARYDVQSVNQGLLAAHTSGAVVGHAALLCRF